jgi:hypothetical protein
VFQLVHLKHWLTGTLSWLLLTLLVRALVLILPVVDILSSWMEGCSLWGRETRAGVVAELP